LEVPGAKGEKKEAHFGGPWMEIKKEKSDTEKGTTGGEEAKEEERKNEGEEGHRNGNNRRGRGGRRGKMKKSERDINRIQISRLWFLYLRIL
jgi:hypothetical protein